jgi:hypothetical protein
MATVLKYSKKELIGGNVKKVKEKEEGLRNGLTVISMMVI